jgi:hypothetical protein
MSVLWVDVIFDFWFVRWGIKTKILAPKNFGARMACFFEVYMLLIRASA